MTSYEDILEAASSPDFSDSVQRIKRLAAEALQKADQEASILSTEHFNHSYFPDLVLKWPNRAERFVFLRTSSYAEEIEEDVRNLAGRNPMFVNLSEFRSWDDTPVQESIDALDRSAGTTQSLVASIPAIGYLDDSPRTGRMLSSLVMRGGKGLIEDHQAQRISQQVEFGFTGALESDRDRTAGAITAVENLLDARSSAEFSHLFEAAWISSGASPMDFPGTVTSIGDDLSSSMLRKLLDIVPESIEDFWLQVGKSVTLETFEQLHLVGDQPRLQEIMRSAVNRLTSKKCSVRVTKRADQQQDPFLWQVDHGILSLRGGGYQAWIGSVPVSQEQDEVSIPPAPSLSLLSTRSDEADLTLSEVNVRGTDDISVTFSTAGDQDVAASDLVERVSNSLGIRATVNEVVVRIEGKEVPVSYPKGLVHARTNAKISVPGLLWCGWNLLADVDQDNRQELQNILGLTEDGTKI